MQFMSKQATFFIHYLLSLYECKWETICTSMMDNIEIIDQIMFAGQKQGHSLVLKHL